ncbi:MAG: nitrile hydratase subunit beta [Rhodobacterales bacterium]
MQSETQITPLKRLDDEPTFTDAWQAQVLAITQNLIAQGAIAADDWSNALGAALRAVQVDAQSDTVENYYQAALNALETVLQATCDVSKQAMEQRKSDWTRAYETTPHGQPVKL